MQILGNYQSTLSSSYYQQLVTLLQQAIQAGDFGGGQTFDQAALVALQQEAQNFSTCRNLQQARWWPMSLSTTRSLCWLLSSLRC